MRDEYNDALENEKKYLEDVKKSLKDPNDERQREIDLREAAINLENANKRKVWAYSEGDGFQQVQNKSTIKDAEEKYRDAVTEIQVAEIDKQIETIENQQEALEENTKALTELESDIRDALIVNKAMEALCLSDSSKLLNLPEDVKQGIINNLMEATLKKDIEDNKGNQQYVPVTLDSLLAYLGSDKKASDILASALDNVKLSAYDKAVKDFSDALKTNVDNSVENITYNNSPVINNEFVIHDATDPQAVAVTVRG